MMTKEQDNQMYPPPLTVWPMYAREIEAGRLFYGGIITTIASEDTRDLLFRVGQEATTITLIEGSGRTGDMNIIIYKNPTVTADGSPLTIGNYNLRNPRPSKSSLFDAPTWTGGEEVIRFPLFNATADNNKTTLSHDSGTFHKHFELEPNADYIICFDNFDVNLDSDFGFSFDWREL